MTCLAVHLLGPMRVELDGRTITGFESCKARALLAYLIVEARRPHPREELAGLLWPDRPDRVALANLRSALSNLRQALRGRGAEPFCLRITREAVQFNSASEHWLDVAVFSRLASAAERDLASVHELAQAAALYEGDFLTGLSVRDSDLFQEWALLRREEFRRDLIAVLRRLVAAEDYRGDYAGAAAHARRWVELDALDEEAHRQLMGSLMLNGERNAALKQYETCRGILAEELGVPPARETVRLAEAIRAGKFTALSLPVVIVAPLCAQDRSDVRAVPFVGRQTELKALDDELRQALAGQGRMVVLRGSAGSGKSALAAEFMRQALRSHRELTAAWGSCEAQMAAGAVFLPFLEILQLLTGQVQVGEAGMPSYELFGTRLRRLLPMALQALVELSPDLIDSFAPASTLLDIALHQGGSPQPWLERLEHLAQRNGAPRAPAGLRQSTVFTQYTALLLALARHHPLILLLDDLQWADGASAGLLCHLGRHLNASRILLICAYRSEDIPRHGGKQENDLAALLCSLRAEHANLQLDLDRSAGEQFIEDLLDSEPNGLGEAFRRTLHLHTGGHPLFTVELLRGMQDRGDLTRDEAGRWVAGADLNWGVLPTRVEAVIEERVGRLVERWQDYLRAASAEGEEFSAEVIAALCGVDEDEAVRELSGELSQKIFMVRAQGLRRVEGRILSRYRFRHDLYRTYLYNSLDEVQRMRLHGAIGGALEAIYAGRASEIAPDLARHYERAGLLPKAVTYLVEAGDRAVRLSANQEAIAYYNHGLSLLDGMPDEPALAEQELDVRVSLGVPLLATLGFGATEVEQNYARARALSRRLPDSPQHFRILSGLKSYHDLRLHLSQARDLGEEMLCEAERLRDRSLLARAHDTLGVTLFYLGQPHALLDHLALVEANYDRNRRPDMAFRFGFDPLVACLSNASWALWFLGYPDQGKRRAGEALALAEELAHPPSLAYARFFAAAFYRYCGLLHPTWELLAATEDLAQEHGLALWKAAVAPMRGWVMSQEGLLEEGLSEMLRGQAAVRALGGELAYLRALPSLAESYVRAGKFEQARATLDEALALIHASGLVTDLPEVWRLKGELALMTGAADEAEACTREAIALAERYGARSWELRAALSLACMLERQGRGPEGRSVLAGVLGAFTEGFDTPDLQQAMMMLAGFEGKPSSRHR